MLGEVVKKLCEKAGLNGKRTIIHVEPLLRQECTSVE